MKTVPVEEWQKEIDEYNKVKWNSNSDALERGIPLFGYMEWKDSCLALAREIYLLKERIGLIEERVDLVEEDILWMSKD